MAKKFVVKDSDGKFAKSKSGAAWVENVWEAHLFNRSVDASNSAARVGFDGTSIVQVEVRVKEDK